MIQIVIRIVPGGDRSRAWEQAVAEVGNASNLAPVSDYVVSAGENQNGVTAAPGWSARGRILQHDRRQSIWALVARVAAWAALEADKAARQPRVRRARRSRFER